jgi:hypothetical protein
MNWQQIFNASTPEERSELGIAMLRHIEARRRRWVLYRGRLIRERRRAQLLHFINDRRQAPQRRRKIAWIASLQSSLVLVLVLSFLLPQFLGAVLVILWDLLLISLWIIKPYLRRPYYA